MKKYFLPSHMIRALKNPDYTPTKFVLNFFLFISLSLILIPVYVWLGEIETFGFRIYLTISGLQWFVFAAILYWAQDPSRRSEFFERFASLLVPVVFWVIIWSTILSLLVEYPLSRYLKQSMESPDFLHSLFDLILDTLINAFAFYKIHTYLKQVNQNP